MNEQQFRRLMGLADTIGGDYAAGYRLGLRRHYHGEQFQLPASVEALSDTGRFGAQAVGFRDGLDGRTPTDPDATTVLHIDNMTVRLKSACVRAAQAEGMKLVPWVLRELERAAKKNA